jgi:hypothetical protein
MILRWQFAAWDTVHALNPLLHFLRSVRILQLSDDLAARFHWKAFVLDMIWQACEGGVHQRELVLVSSALFADRQVQPKAHPCGERQLRFVCIRQESSRFGAG